MTRPIKQGASGGLLRWLRRLFRGPEAAPRHLASGEWGEDVACAELRRAGFKVLGRRVRVGRRDEIDILARDGAETLVFVEVKTRASEAFGRPADAVGREKQRNLSRAALRYLGRLGQKPRYFRFDVVEVVGSPGGGPPVVRHLRNAFPLSKPYHVPWT